MASLSDRMMALARDLAAQPDQEGTLEQVLETVTALVPHADDVGITLTGRRGGITTPAANGPVPTRSDKLQETLGEGPCVDAIWVERLIVAPDLRVEPRWPRWAPRVVEELGVHSMMCVRLFTHADTVGAINLFSHRTDAFDAQDRDRVQAAAAHAAVAVATAGRIDNLQAAMSSRTATARATGLVMCRYSLGADAAFEVLRRLSSEQNRKVSVIAAEIIADHEDAVRATRR